MQQSCHQKLQQKWNDIGLKELIGIHGYIRINYYQKLKMKEKLNITYNTIIDNGIIEIIQIYCKPLIREPIDALHLCKITEQMAKYPEAYRNMGVKTVNKYGPKNYKLVVVGANGMGKTSLLMVYADNHYPLYHIPNAFDTDSVDIKVNGNDATLELCDIASGQEINYRFRPLSYSCADVFLVCMSVYDDRKSDYYKCDMWTDQQIITMAFAQEVQACGPGVLCLFVGMKCDLRGDEEFKNDCYTKREMEFFAIEGCKCDGYMECSSLEYDVKPVFDYAIKLAVKYQASLKRPEKKKGSNLNCIFAVFCCAFAVFLLNFWCYK